LDEVLEMLDRTAKRIQKVLEESKKTASKQTTAYEKILQSKEASEEQKVKALMGKTLELDRLERLSAQLSLLYALQIFAFKVKVLEITVSNINEQLVKSGILQKSTELEAIKKNIDALKILVEAQYKSMREIREDQGNNLTYIHESHSFNAFFFLFLAFSAWFLRMLSQPRIYIEFCVEAWRLYLFKQMHHTSLNRCS
jgi:hypothetical protein